MIPLGQKLYQCARGWKSPEPVIHHLKQVRECRGGKMDWLITTNGRFYRPIALLLWIEDPRTEGKGGLGSSGLNERHALTPLNARKGAHIHFGGFFLL
jgi:hypothetical protein